MKVGYFERPFTLYEPVCAWLRPWSPGNCTTVVSQSRDEAKQENQEYEETRRQIEEDADRELLNMRTRHEQIVRDEQVESVECHHVTSSPSFLALNSLNQCCDSQELCLHVVEWVTVAQLIDLHVYGARNLC